MEKGGGWFMEDKLGPFFIREWRSAWWPPVHDAFLLASAFAGWSPSDSLVTHVHAPYFPVSQALELDLPGFQSTL